MARSRNLSCASWLSRNGYPGYSEEFAGRVLLLVADGYSIRMAMAMIEG